jgi:hypothetical protein
MPYRDKPSAAKEKINAIIEELNGPYKPEFAAHAVYLDGSEMRTTGSLLKFGWPPEKMHVPNCDKKDCEKINQHALSINVYESTCGELFKSSSGASWVQKFRDSNNKCGPFTLVVLDVHIVKKHKSKWTAQRW